MLTINDKIKSKPKINNKLPDKNLLSFNVFADTITI
jgi:hypothetical protein